MCDVFSRCQDEPVEADSAAGDQTPGACGLSVWW